MHLSGSQSESGRYEHIVPGSAHGRLTKHSARTGAVSAAQLSADPRSLVEQIMVDKIGEHESFFQNLADFHGEGYLTSIPKNWLVTVLDCGHASVHRKYKPELEDIRTVLDIVESLIADIYVHPERAKRLAERVPGRKRLSNRKLG